MDLEDDDIEFVAYKGNLAIVTGKGFQRTTYFSRVVHLHKKPRKGDITRDQIEFKKTVESCRIIVEDC